MFFIDIIDFFMNIWIYVYKLYKNSIISMKHELFDGYLISCGSYNVNEKRYVSIYNYDNTLMIIYLYILYIFGCNIHENYNLINFRKYVSNDKHNIYICSVLYGNEQYYIIIDQNTHLNLPSLNNINNENKSTKKFLYVVFDDNNDLTHEFEKFKHFILENKYLETYDIIKMLQMFFYNKVTVNNDTILKLMMDDSFDEKTYKGKELLIIT